MALNFMGKMRIWKIYGNLIILDLEILYTMYIIYCIQKGKGEWGKELLEGNQEGGNILECK